MASIAREWTIEPRGVGLPDYSSQAPIGGVPQGSIYTNNDNGELATRLGAYNSIDRRGSVVIHDNFENGLSSWVPTLGAGAGSDCEWSTESFRNGGFSMKLSGGLATNSSVRRSWGVDNPNKAGMEFSFAIELFNILSGISYYSDNVNQYYAMWYLVGAQLYVFDATAGAVLVSNDVEALFDDQSYNTIKMVWDTQTALYTRILFNQNEFDITQRSVPFLPAPIAGKHMAAEFQIASAAARNDYTYLDDFIATINEPNNT
ncbi:MAG: hypothetical protein PHO67_08130 [Candidatus Omnitrophica bacterium]|nr:hypothetical protein [Candidatus Omnitrophota bacterium]